MLRPGHAVWGLTHKKASQPTSLDWVSGFHFASLGQTFHYFDTVTSAFSAEEHPMQVCKGVRGVHFGSPYVQPRCLDPFRAPMVPYDKVLGNRWDARAYVCPFIHV